MKAQTNTVVNQVPMMICVTAIGVYAKISLRVSESMYRPNPLVMNKHKTSLDKDH